MANERSALSQAFSADKAGLLKEWLAGMQKKGWDGANVKGLDVASTGREFLELIEPLIEDANPDVNSASAAKVRQFLETLSRTFAALGFTPEQTATFVFSLKQPVFARIRANLSKDPDALASETWRASEFVDALGMHTINTFQKSREDVIRRQQEEMLELSTPVVKLWEGVLALPMIGTLDSARTQVVMESLLQSIVDTGSSIAIIDITGVPTVDTLVAQHLLRTVAAIRLLGADCIVSGIRPQIAQTIVHLGIELEGIATRATLADALALALRRMGVTIVKAKEA